MKLSNALHRSPIDGDNYGPVGITLGLDRGGGVTAQALGKAKKLWKNRVVGAALVAALGQPQELPLRRDGKTRFFHSIEAFPQSRRQSRFRILTFRDFDATLTERCRLLTRARPFDKLIGIFIPKSRQRRGNTTRRLCWSTTPATG